MLLQHVAYSLYLFYKDRFPLFLFKASFSSRITLFTAIKFVDHPPQNVALPLSAVIPRRSWNLKLYDLQQEIVHKSTP